MLDHLEGKGSLEIVERDDGFITVGGGPATYFAAVRQWPSVERRAMRWVRGRVLDVGCGAGRGALLLQERGHPVTAIDVSPLAVEVARRRGVRDARVVPFERVDRRLGRFDCVVMLGNNFGLFRSAAGARAMLRRLHAITGDDARIVAASNDPYRTDDRAHLAYHRLNRSRGRMPGQLRIRIRHRQYATPWFDYLLVSPKEMARLVGETGWAVRHLVSGSGGLYVGVLEKVTPKRPPAARR